MTLSYDPPSLQPSTRSLAEKSKSSLHDRPTGPLVVLKPERTSLKLPGSDCVIKPNVRLASLTSFRVGGPAEWYTAPQRIADLAASLAWADREGLAVTLLGAGSNLLVSDAGLPGLVICTRHLRHMHFDEATGQVTVGAGEPIARLAWRAAERGWQGLEWAVGIPGTVGGAVVMNAGAHDTCAADRLIRAQVLNRGESLSNLTPADLDYSYRSSRLQTMPQLVVQATLQLQPGADPQKLMAITSQNLEQRKNSQPYHLPSCGSVFRNPHPYKAGWLIEQSGLKGHQIGGAEVAHRHANFILNRGNATASDIFRLITHIQERVAEHWSLSLKPEVKILGDFQLA